MARYYILQQERDSSDNQDIILSTLHLHLLPLQFGNTALGLARDEGHTNIVSLLEQYQH